MGHYLRSKTAHPHQLPPGEQWSSPASNRECFKNGDCHVNDGVVKCDVEGCDKFMGHRCERCRKVV